MIEVATVCGGRFGMCFGARGILVNFQCVQFAERIGGGAFLFALGSGARVKSTGYYGDTIRAAMQFGQPASLPNTGPHPLNSDRCSEAPRTFRET